LVFFGVIHVIESSVVEQPALKMEPVTVPKLQHLIRNMDVSEKTNNVSKS